MANYPPHDLVWHRAFAANLAFTLDTLEKARLACYSRDGHKRGDTGLLERAKKNIEDIKLRWFRMAEDVSSVDEAREIYFPELAEQVRKDRQRFAPPERSDSPADD